MIKMVMTGRGTGQFEFGGEFSVFLVGPQIPRACWQLQASEEHE